MFLILTGATGTVGVGVLRYCLVSSRVTRLVILSRRDFDIAGLAPGLDTSKARVVVHRDYTTYPQELLNELDGAAGIIWAQGISQTEVTRDQYVRITHDYPIAAASALTRLNAGSTGDRHFNFVYVSGEGADPAERSWFYFGNIKGRTERELLQLAQHEDYARLRVFNVRPGAVDPPLWDRLGLFKRVSGRILAPLLKLLLPSSAFCSVDQVGKVMVDLALSDGKPVPAGPGIEAEGRTIRNVAVNAWK